MTNPIDLAAINTFVCKVLENLVEGINKINLWITMDYSENV